VASAAGLGALGTGLAFVINMHNIRVAGASTASTVTYVIPVFAVLVGALVLDERLTWHQPVGALVVLLGVAVAQGLLGPRSSRVVPTLPAATAEPSAAAEPAVR
jgi:drug/metabolite transporter (DMT)-like permease